MARYLGPVCKLCRREGVKLFLKGDRCVAKCTLDKRSAPPGQHGSRRSKMSEYAKHLREKQKARWVSGVLERQFRRVYHEAERLKGTTGENFLRLLETRLDNVVRRLGFASSIKAGRQLVLHGHVKVNGRRVNIPSYGLKPGDEILLSERMRNNVFVKIVMENQQSRGQAPPWLEINTEGFAGKLLHWPSRQEMSYPVNEQLIVEYYSK